MNHLHLVVFLAAAGGFLVLTVFIIWQRSSRRRRGRRIQDHDQSRSVLPIIRNKRAPISELFAITTGKTQSFDRSLNRFSIDELRTATQNFSPELIIGKGDFGLMYKGQLSSGVPVAVKHLLPDAVRGFREFHVEMDTLAILQHPNIATFLGYCATVDHRVLVYEFMERGSLDLWLHHVQICSENDGDGENSNLGGSSSDMASGTRAPLPWRKRLSIIRGVAKGLSYLHNLKTPIIHRNIKASNVWLDANFDAHIADFGLARIVEGLDSQYDSTSVAGSMGYMPPEYDGHDRAAPTTKGDVYSFGVLMLETATGRGPYDPITISKGEMHLQVSLVDWVNDIGEEERFLEIVDVNISKDELEHTEVVDFFMVAMLCVSKTSVFRPAMDEVLEMLQRIPA